MLNFYQLFFDHFILKKLAAPLGAGCQKPNQLTIAAIKVGCVRRNELKIIL
jgi:hypothetical protein